MTWVIQWVLLICLARVLRWTHSSNHAKYLVYQTVQYQKAPSFAITSTMVAQAVKDMKRGKSPGHDGLSIEHLQYAGGHWSRVLAILFTWCLRHSYSPCNLIKTIVTPLIKNSTGDIADKSNYRPISLAMVAKVLDRILDKHLRQHIQLSDAQFGFQQGLSTVSAIVTLKHSVDYYTKSKSPVYACFLDFDKNIRPSILWDLLWDKLRLTGVAPEVVDIFLICIVIKGTMLNGLMLIQMSIHSTVV